jgi:transposase
VGTIQAVISKAQALDLRWPLPEELDDVQLAQLFYPKADARPASRCQIPDWSMIHLELKRKGMTKQLLWEEYTQQYPNRCYSYSQFCDRYQHWLKKQKRSMRQTHRAGEKLFVDYAGQTVPIVCAQTGEFKSAQVFVAVFGASNYTYCEATWTQTLPDWLSAHVRAFAFFGGVPQIVVPDNLKSGINKACRYDPVINRNYQQLASHYCTAIIPARPAKPKDKAKVEVGVQIIERWILAKLRHHTFFSLAELNQCIKTLLTEANLKPFKRLPGNRKQWFEQLDKPALKPLPKHRWHYVDIKPAKVNIDYHIYYQQHLYSVPHHLVGETVEIHASDQLIDILYQHRLMASHARKFQPGTTTVPAHMPIRHAKHQQWTPGRLRNWAQRIGPEVEKWVQTQLKRKDHPEQAYRVCLGLLNLARQYPEDRLNNACAIANQHALYRLTHIKNILKTNQDKQPIQRDIADIVLPQDHDNLRGPGSFH